MKVMKPEQIEEKKKRILEAALAIIKEDGLDGLSIRKIASRIQQTPGIIYHYYTDKDAILEAVVMDGYEEILLTLQKSRQIAGNASEKLYFTLKSYIQLMLQKGDVFLILMNSRNPRITSQIDLLHEHIRTSRKSMDALCKGIEEGIAEGLFECEQIELRAQCIWCSIYGLLERIIQEKPEKQQQEKLIEEELRFILSSLRR